MIFNNYQLVLMSKPDSYILPKLHLVKTVLTSLLANSFAQGLALKNSFCQGLTDFQPANECHNNNTGIYVAWSKWNSSVLRNWQPIKLQENKFESVLALTFTVRKIAHSIPNEFHSSKNIWTQNLFNLLNFRYMTLTEYTMWIQRKCDL